MGEYIKLIGILIIVLGFALKLDVLAVVICAAVVTGLISGMDIATILTTLGQAFVSQRLMSIFLIMFPVIAILERYGLKERAAYLIGKLKNASAGVVLTLYTVIRFIASAFNVRLGGHIQFIRPLILPMSLAASENKKGDRLNEEELEQLKGINGAIENYANFYGQNCFPAASGVVLIQGTLVSLGYTKVTLQSIAASSFAIFFVALILTIGQIALIDRKLKKGAKK